MGGASTRFILHNGRFVLQVPVDVLCDALGRLRGFLAELDHLVHQVDRWEGVIGRAHLLDLPEPVHRV